MTDLNFLKNRPLVFEKNANCFSPKKSQKIVIITSAPGGTDPAETQKTDDPEKKGK
jgi:hypothetical protein